MEPNARHSRTRCVWRFAWTHSATTTPTRKTKDVDCFTDHRDPDLIERSVLELVTQRVFGLCLGYEDLNDHDELRHAAPDEFRRTTLQEITAIVHHCEKCGLSKLEE